MDQKKVLEHIHNVINTDQFIRYCYLNLNGDEGMVKNAEFDDYISHVRREVFENGYTEEDLQQIIKDGKELAKSLDGLTIG